MGLALSVVAPTVYSLAGDAAPGRTGEASSVLTTIGYGGYLIGPVLVGGVAEVAGLRLALATVILAGLGIVLFSSAIRQPVPTRKLYPVGVASLDELAEPFSKADL